MSFKYSLVFKPSALKEWKKLAPAIRDKFKKKLTKRLDDPALAQFVQTFVSLFQLLLKSDGNPPFYIGVQK